MTRRLQAQRHDIRVDRIAKHLAKRAGRQLAGWKAFVGQATLLLEYGTPEEIAAVEHELRPKRRVPREFR